MALADIVIPNWALLFGGGFIVGNIWHAIYMQFQYHKLIAEGENGNRDERV